MRRFASRFALLFILCSALFLLSEVETVKADGPIYIRADGSVKGTDKIHRDGNVYTFTDDIDTNDWEYGIVIERNNIVVDGAGYLLKGHGPFTFIDIALNKRITTGVSLDGRNNVIIKNLQIWGFNLGFRGKRCTNIKILENNIKKVATNLIFEYSSHNIISGNNMINNGTDGIYFFQAHNNTIAGNYITDNNNGIDMWSSYNNTVSGNKITKSDDTGIQIEFSSKYNIVSGNCITDNYHGIGIAESFNNTVSGNHITNNIKYGIWLGRQASNNIFSENIIANNDVGVYIREASNNKFYNNNFINNTKQVYDLAWDFPHVALSVNIWDAGYPSGGNYWSNYAGQDLDGDGIGDTPYIINKENIDRYPLMDPVKIPEFPDDENPTTWIVAAIVIIAVVGAVLLVYFAKVKKTTEKAE